MQPLELPASHQTLRGIVKSLCQHKHQFSQLWNWQHFTQLTGTLFNHLSFTQSVLALLHFTILPYIICSFWHKHQFSGAQFSSLVRNMLSDLVGLLPGPAGTFNDQRLLGWVTLPVTVTLWWTCRSTGHVWSATLQGGEIAFGRRGCFWLLVRNGRWAVVVIPTCTTTNLDVNLSAPTRTHATKRAVSLLEQLNPRVQFMHK